MPPPRPPAHLPQRPAPRPSSPAAIILIVVVVAVLLVMITAGFFAVRWLSASAQPSVVAGPSSVAMPSFSQAPTTPRPSTTTRADAIPIVYAASLSATCKPIAAATDWASTQAVFSAQQACLDAQWTAVFAKAGRTFAPPQVTFVTQNPTTRCVGDPPDPKVYPAYYCADDTFTIYIWDTITPAVVATRAEAFVTLSHEYAHHVQYLISAREGATGEKEELTRRSELQAQCLSMYQFATTKGLGTAPADLDRMKQGWGRDTPHHGSAASRLLWNQTGLAGTKIGDCNTWAAPADKVS